MTLGLWPHGMLLVKPPSQHRYERGEGWGEGEKREGKGWEMMGEREGRKRKEREGGREKEGEGGYEGKRRRKRKESGERERSEEQVKCICCPVYIFILEVVYTLYVVMCVYISTSHDHFRHTYNTMFVLHNTQHFYQDTSELRTAFRLEHFR